MDFRLVYPSGAIVVVEADSEEEAQDIGFAFGALPDKQESPEEKKEAA